MIKVEGVSIESGEFTLNDLNFSIPSGVCGTLMGSSGSGKTSIMEALCGLRKVSSGKIWINDKDVSCLAPSERNIGLVPQDNVLFHTMSVYEQIAYGPRVRKGNLKELDCRVREVAEQLQITHLLERKTKKLSGGEAKRVALARAIAPKPKVLCLDESFTGLDDDTQSEVLQVIKQTIQQEKITTLFITHSQREADLMGDVHFVIRDGLIKPRE